MSVCTNLLLTLLQFTGPKSLWLYSCRVEAHENHVSTKVNTVHITKQYKTTFTQANVTRLSVCERIAHDANYCPVNWWGDHSLKTNMFLFWVAKWFIHLLVWLSKHLDEHRPKITQISYLTEYSKFRTVDLHILRKVVVVEY